MMDIALDLGEPGYAPPEEAIVAGAHAMIAGPAGYAPPAGLPDLREAAANAARAHGILATVDRVTITTGASLGLFAALAVSVQPGDEVLIPDPGYPPYARMVRLLGARPRPYPLRAAQRFQVDVAGVERSIGSRTRALVWNAPANPMGAVAAPSAVAGLAALAERHQLTLISDEAYDRLILDGAHISPAALGTDARILTVFSFSKTYALTGWRVGYVVASAEDAANIARIQWSVAMSPCTVGQIVARACLDAPVSYHTAVLDDLRGKRNQATALLSRAGIPHHHPAAGFFLWVDLRAITPDAGAFVHTLREEERVAVMPGEPFGGEGRGWVRILYSASHDELDEGLSRLIRLYDRWAGRAGSSARL